MLPTRALGLGTGLRTAETHSVFGMSSQDWTHRPHSAFGHPRSPPGKGDRVPQHARHFDHRGGGLKEAWLAGSGYTHCPTDS